MIQRIQTLYLFIAFVLNAVCLSFPIGKFTDDGRLKGELYNLWLTQENGTHSFTPWILFVILLATLSMTLITIFAYRKRMLQSQFCSLNILLLICYYVCFAVLVIILKSRYEADFGICIIALLPIISLILYYMAKRAIKADEKLVRASDRIR